MDLRHGAATSASPWWFAGILPLGYGFAWRGHFHYEHNWPATFQYPFRSLHGDVKMFYCMLTGRMAKSWRKSAKLYPPSAA